MMIKRYISLTTIILIIAMVTTVSFATNTTNNTGSNEVNDNTTTQRTFPVIDFIQDENNLKKIKIVAGNKTSNITEIKIAMGSNLAEDYFTTGGTSLQIQAGKTVEVECEVQEFGTYTIYAKCENNYAATRQKSIDDCSNEPIRLDAVRDIQDFNKINVRVISKEKNITSLKYAQGKQEFTYFDTNGKVLETNGTKKIETQFIVEVSDTYTVYAATESNKIKISKSIGNIQDTTAPRITGVSEGKTYNEVTPIIEDANLSEITLTKDGRKVENYTSGIKLSEKGNYTLTAKDTEGNTTTVNFVIGKNAETPITSSVYTIQGGYIYKIKNGTKISELKENITSNNEIKVMLEGNIVADTEILKTGMTLSSGNSEYKIVVAGDIDGNGNITVNDLALLRQFVLNTKTPTEIQKIAANLDYNDKISINDLALMRNIILNKE